MPYLQRRFPGTFDGMLITAIVEFRPPDAQPRPRWDSDSGSVAFAK
jgi:hypothetical protein